MEMGKNGLILHPSKKRMEKGLLSGNQQPGTLERRGEEGKLKFDENSKF